MSYTWQFVIVGVLSVIVGEILWWKHSGGTWKSYILYTKALLAALFDLEKENRTK